MADHSPALILLQMLPDGVTAVSSYPRRCGNLPPITLVYFAPVKGLRRQLARRVVQFLTPCARRRRFNRPTLVPRHPFHYQVSELTIDAPLPSLRTMLVAARIAVGQLPGDVLPPFGSLLTTEVFKRK